MSALWKTILGIPVGMLLACFVWAVLVEAVSGKPTPSAASVLDVKDQHLHEIASPRIVAIAGSSALYGINAAQLEQTTGMHAYNYGSGASIGLFYMLHRAERVLQKGDIALLALEYQNYGDQDLTSEAIKALFSHQDVYRFEQGMLGYLRLLAALDASFLTDVLMTALTGAAPEDSTTGRLNRHGDYLLHAAEKLDDTLRAKVKREPLVPVERMRLTDFARQQLSRFIAACRQKGVTVIATWPAMLDDPAFHEGEYQQVFAELRTFYTVQNVPIAGDWQTSLHTAEHMFDTRYHLHQQASIPRSVQLGEALLPLLPPRTSSPEHLHPR